MESLDNSLSRCRVGPALGVKAHNGPLAAAQQNGKLAILAGDLVKTDDLWGRCHAVHVRRFPRKGVGLDFAKGFRPASRRAASNAFQTTRALLTTGPGWS